MFIQDIIANFAIEVAAGAAIFAGSALLTLARIGYRAKRDLARTIHTVLTQTHEFARRPKVRHGNAGEFTAKEAQALAYDLARQDVLIGFVRNDLAKAHKAGKNQLSDKQRSAYRVFKSHLEDFYAYRETAVNAAEGFKDRYCAVFEAGSAVLRALCGGRGLAKEVRDMKVSRLD